MEFLPLLSISYHRAIMVIAVSLPYSHPYNAVLIPTTQEIFSTLKPENFFTMDWYCSSADGLILSSVSPTAGKVVWAEEEGAVAVKQTHPSTALKKSYQVK